MKKKLLLLTVFELFLFSFVNQSQAGDVKGRMNIGLNYPGISFRYGISSKIALEGRFQTGEGITVIGPRAYYYFSPLINKIKIFAGAEIDMIFFKGNDSEGSGIAIEGFGGGEYFINKKLSVSLDMGPAMILLSDSDTGENVSGMEIIVNFSVNYYFR